MANNKKISPDATAAKPQQDESIKQRRRQLADDIGYLLARHWLESAAASQPSPKGAKAGARQDGS